MYALYGSKELRKKFGNFHFRQQSRDLEQKFANFLRCKCGRGKLQGGNNTGSGSGRKHKLFSRVTQPIHNHTREPHTSHTTPNMDMDNEIESIDDQSEEVAVAAAAAASIMMGLIEQEAEDEDYAGAHGE